MRTTSHPGEILLHEFMEPLNLSARSLAKRLNTPPNRITAIIKAERSVTADTALLLGEAFSTTAEFWLNLQTNYDLSKARAERKSAPAEKIDLKISA